MKALIILTIAIAALGRRNWTVTGGSLFWFDAAGDGWRMDLDTETVESYEMSSIEAVTE